MPDLATYALPLLFALGLWWFSTGLILWLVRLPRTHRPVVLTGATLLLAIALIAIIRTADDVAMAAGYHAFAAALAIWGWHELTFLLGLVTGPRKAPLAPGASAGQRFRQATAAIAYHEAALAATAALLVLLTWGAENQVAAWTFGALWITRLSAKLNLFLGVPHFGDELMPDQLRHLRSYFAVRAINPLFPLSVTAITAAAALFLAQAWAPGTTPAEVAGLICLAGMLLLGAVEHWFMVLPIRDAALWRWAAGRAGADMSVPLDTDTTRFEPRPTPAAGSG
ncbi:putative photosynthetic complex assembly protein PuhE [Thalassobaculum sp. OXR-137]|uniref:putative photosynthetic complex assembly protein PuhE n=1 Tax=Thalassobaculum sp. OXR-137 TaxID=3100173 RepID=UPI002AC9B132|nr:putative photosynthetic complex assembly protein PuhE [Thalassobaculum sp. OXR-137]WPZ36819.1 putative photosynthetic complex assembly protein PuhE [Thalassobaculum sp. OXR-137]